MKAIPGDFSPSFAFPDSLQLTVYWSELRVTPALTLLPVWRKNLGNAGSGLYLG